MMEANSKQFIFVVHHCKKQSSKKEWADYFSVLGKHVNGGSSLGKGVGVKNGKNINPKAKTIGGS